MPLSDLLTNPATGRLSHSKLWANVACAVASAMFIRQGWHGPLGAEVWLAYLGMVGGYSAARRWIASQRGQPGASDAG